MYAKWPVNAEKLFPLQFCEILNFRIAWKNTFFCDIWEFLRNWRIFIERIFNSQFQFAG